MSPYAHKDPARRLRGAQATAQSHHTTVDVDWDAAIRRLRAILEDVDREDD